jgi:ABC-type transporter Mla subunit MlaD
VWGRALERVEGASMISRGADRTEIPVPTTLNQFLANLATDADLLADYLRDKARVIRQAGLLVEDLEVLLSGEEPAMAERLELLVPSPTVREFVKLSTGATRLVRVVTEGPSKKVYEPSQVAPTYTH